MVSILKFEYTPTETCMKIAILTIDEATALFEISLQILN